MARSRSARAVSVVLLLLAGGTVGYLLTPPAPAPQERHITIRARQFAFDPAVIRVNRGDTVHLRLYSEDVVHGFYLEGHDIDARIAPLSSNVMLHRPSAPEEVKEVETITLTAERTGTFRYRCSHTCGSLHPFMQGELIVGPNRLFPISLGAAVGLAVALLVALGRSPFRG